MTKQHKGLLDPPVYYMPLCMIKPDNYVIEYYQTGYLDKAEGEKQVRFLNSEEDRDYCKWELHKYTAEGKQNV